ncbi:hypothetical protein MMC18_001837 [Xylographa bjoerkii]|nr:hypothetical protein [Xylographa bjoerkii]
MPCIVIAGKETEVDPNDPACVYAAQLWLQELCKPERSAELEQHVDIVAELLVDHLLWPSLMRSVPVLTIKAVDVPANGGGAIGALQRTLKEAGLLGPLLTRPDNPSESPAGSDRASIDQTFEASCSSRSPSFGECDIQRRRISGNDGTRHPSDDEAEKEFNVEERELMYYVLCHLKHCFDGPAVDEFVKAINYRD